MAPQDNIFRTFPFTEGKIDKVRIANDLEDLINKRVYAFFAKLDDSTDESLGFDHRRSRSRSLVAKINKQIRGKRRQEPLYFEVEIGNLTLKSKIFNHGKLILDAPFILRIGFDSDSSAHIVNSEKSDDFVMRSHSGKRAGIFSGDIAIKRVYANVMISRIFSDSLVDGGKMSDAFHELFTEAYNFANLDTVIEQEKDFLFEYLASSVNFERRINVALGHELTRNGKLCGERYVHAVEYDSSSQ